MVESDIALILILREIEIYIFLIKYILKTLHIKAINMTVLIC